jgi:hypothetical protein
MNNLADRVDTCLRMLIAAAHEGGISTSGDLRVGELDAAHMLGMSGGHLKAIRQEGRGPTPYSRGVGGSRVSYRLVDLAMWIEAGRIDW